MMDQFKGLKIGYIFQKDKACTSIRAGAQMDWLRACAFYVALALITLFRFQYKIANVQTNNHHHETLPEILPAVGT
jgi:hypothetical protein